MQTWKCELRIFIDITFTDINIHWHQHSLTSTFIDPHKLHKDDNVCLLRIFYWYQHSLIHTKKIIFTDNILLISTFTDVNIYWYQHSLIHTKKTIFIENISLISTFTDSSYKEDNIYWEYFIDINIYWYQ